MIRPVHRRPRRLRPALEALDSRTLLSVTVQIDYSHDSRGFFNDPTRRALLQMAADTVASRLGDSLDAIVPGGGNTWTLTTDDPGNGGQFSVSNLVVPANTVIVYAGGRPLFGSELGQGGFGASSATGSKAWLDTVTSRGQSGALAATPTDFGPWGGTVTFDTNTLAAGKWYFGTDPSGLKSGQDDFLSVALHEMEHLFGFGTAPSWNAQVSGGKFLGVNAGVEYAVPGLPPVSADGGHWAQGTRDQGQEVAMDPSVLMGTRKLLTPLDLVALEDIGWTLTPDPDATIGTAQQPSELNIDANNLAATVAGTLALSNPTDVDMYRVTVDGPRTITFTTSTNAYLRLFTSSGDELAHTGSTPGKMVVTFPAAGAYVLGVSGVGNSFYSPANPLLGSLAGTSGTYTLSFAEGGTRDGGTNNTRADLGVTIDAPPSAPIGSPLNYTVKVTNSGPDSASGVAIAVSWPDSSTLMAAVPTQGTARVSGSVIRVGFGTIPAGGTASLVVTIQPGQAGTLSYSASVTTTTTDPALANNAASATTTVPPAGGGNGDGSVGGASGDAPPMVLSARLVKVRVGKKKVIRQIVIVFNEAIDPGTASDLSLYTLTRPGRARKHLPPPRIPVALKAASYTPGSISLALTPALGPFVPRGLQLRISSAVPGGIHDTAGTPLDGNGDGTPGGDAVVKLS